MKKIHLFLLLGCLLSTSMSEAIINNNRDTKEIDLSGDLPPKKQRSLVKPIQVFLSDRFLEVDFNDSLGVIVISIYDETDNAVYEQSVSTYAGQQIFIDTTSLNAGVYTIEFVNSNDEYLCGSFEIERE